LIDYFHIKLRNTAVNDPKDHEEYACMV